MGGTVTECRACETKDGALRTLQEQLDTLALDYAGANREVLRLRRETTKLRRDLAKLHEEDPSSAKVRGLLEEWRFQTGHFRSAIPIDGKRADAVRKALGWFSRPDNPMAGESVIRRAFVGAGRFPYVVGYERSASNGDGSPRRDEIETILKSEAQIEKLAALADDAPERPEPVKSSRGHSVDEGPLERVLGALQAHGFRTRPTEGGVLSQCPGCGDELFVRTVEREGLGLLVLADCYGVPACSRNAILELLGLGGGDLVEVRQVSSGFPGPFRLAEHLRETMRRMLAASEPA